MKMGDKLLATVNDFDSAMVIHNKFNIIAPTEKGESNVIINANTIIKLNNEVYREFNNQYKMEQRVAYLRYKDEYNEMVKGI